MGDWIKRIAGVAVACGPAAYDALLTGQGWRGAILAFVGCVMVHQSRPFTRK